MPNTSRPPIGEVFDPANIPAEIQQTKRWGVWRAIWNERRQKWDKVPYHPLTGNGLSTRSANAWCTFQEALQALQDNPRKYAGLGLVLTGAPDLVGVDLDGCLSPEGVPEPWAQEIVERLGSYTERSPSRQGLRILAHGTTASDFVNHERGIEVYNGHTPRFLTITGDVVRADPLRALNGDLVWLEEQYRRKADVTPIVPAAEVPELIDAALLPDLADAGVPLPTRLFLATGESEHGDNSLALHTAGIQLLEVGFTQAEVLSLLASSPGSAEVALAHRSQDWDRAVLYLWVEHVLKAAPKARTPDSVLADFEDVSEGQPTTALKPPSERPKHRFALQDYEAFTKPRKTLWIVKRLLPQAELGVIYGASGSGKSFLALDLVACASRGAEWCGHPSKPTQVVYVTAEGQEDFRRRVTAYALSQGIHDQVNGGMNLWFVDEAPNLLDVADSRELVRQIAACPGGMPGLVVIDTLAQVMPGGNENSGEDVGKVLGHCRAISRATGAMVLLIHHSGKDEARGARGWSGLRAAADFEMEVLRDGPDRIATLTKLKGGEDGLQFPFRLHVMPLDIDEDGDEITSCIVQHQTSVPLHKVNAKNAIEQAVLQAVNTLRDTSGQWATLNDVAQNAVQFLPEPDDGTRDRRKVDVDRALSAMIQRGELLSEGGNSLISIPPIRAKD